MFCLCFLFLTISVRHIISTSTGPVFAKFAGLVDVDVDELFKVCFVDPSREFAWQTIFVGFVGFCQENWVCVPFGRWRHTTRSASAALDAGKPIN